MLAANERWGLSFADHHAQGKVVKHSGLKSKKIVEIARPTALVKSRIVLHTKKS